MSAEPGRKAPYSEDIRWRVVWQKIGMGLKFRTIARNLSVSLGTVHNHFKRFEETGDVMAASKASRENLRALNSEQELLLVGLLYDNPALYLSEVCHIIQQTFGIEVSPSTVCRILHRNGLSRKKIKQVATQRSNEKRGRFMAEAMFFTAHQFVWVDESGCDKKDHMRKFGYSLRGEPPVYHRFLHRGERHNVICAMSTQGVVAYEWYKGSINGDKFLDFVQGVLIPEMQPFDGQSSHSILVMDNCSIHHIQPVVETLTQMGVLTLFVPPYSPDMNPIEELFSYFKYYLKDHDTVLQAMQDPLPLLKAGLDSVTAQQCCAWIRHAGYE